MTKKTVELTAEESAALVRLNDNMQACNDFLGQMQQRCQAQLVQLQGETRNVWTQLADKYDLDLKHVNYELSRDGKSLVATAERFDV